MKKFKPIRWLVKVECKTENIIIGEDEEISGDSVVSKYSKIFLRKLDSDNERKDTAIGKVVEVGPLCFTYPDGTPREPDFKLGDTVMYKRHEGISDDRELEDTVYRYLNDTDVFAVEEVEE